MSNQRRSPASSKTVQELTEEKNLRDLLQDYILEMQDRCSEYSLTLTLSELPDELQKPPFDLDKLSTIYTDYYLMHDDGEYQIGYGEGESDFENEDRW